MTPPRPPGIWTGVLCGLGVLQAVAVLIFASSSTEWFQASLSDDVLWVRLAIGWTTVQVSLLLLSIGVF